MIHQNPQPVLSFPVICLLCVGLVSFFPFIIFFPFFVSGLFQCLEFLFLSFPVYPWQLADLSQSWAAQSIPCSWSCSAESWHSPWDEVHEQFCLVHRPSVWEAPGRCGQDAGRLFGMPAGVCSVASAGAVSTSPLPLPEWHEKRQPWAAATELFGLNATKRPNRVDSWKAFWHSLML